MNKPFPLPPHPDPTTHHWPWGTVPPGPGARWLVTQGRCPVLHSLYLPQSIPVPTPLCSELPSWSHIADGETEVWRGVVTSSQSCGLAGAETGGWISPAYRPSGPGQSEDHPPPTSFSSTRHLQLPHQLQVQNVRRLPFLTLFFFLTMLGLCCCSGFSLRRLHLLQSTGPRAHGLRSCDSQALEHRLNGCGAPA